MNQLSDKKIKEALQRIQHRRKDSWLQDMISEVERVDAELNNTTDPDMNKVGANFTSMDKIYKELDEKLEDKKESGKSNQQVYKEIYSSFSKSFQEHMKILTDHAKETIHDIQEEKIEKK